MPVGEPERVPIFAVNPHKNGDLRNNAQAAGTPFGGLWVTWAIVGTGPGAPTFWGWGVASRKARFPHKTRTKGASRAEDRRRSDLTG